MAGTGKSEVERFHATSGRVTGWLTLLVTSVVVVVGLFYLDEGFPVWMIPAAVLVAALAWAAMLRPALWVSGDHLVMRNMIETVHIRLAAIEEMAVRQVLAVRADERRWVSTVVGHTWRRSMTGSTPVAQDAARPATTVKYADFVEDRLRELVEQARASAGVRAGSPEQIDLPDAVRRQRAWLPTAVIAAAAVVLLVTILL